MSLRAREPVIMARILYRIETVVSAASRADFCV